MFRAGGKDEVGVLMLEAHTSDLLYVINFSLSLQTFQNNCFQIKPIFTLPSYRPDSSVSTPHPQSVFSPHFRGRPEAATDV